MPTGVTPFDFAAHQRARIRTLEHRVRALEAEERKLYRLLTLALQYACHQDSIQPLRLLELLHVIDGSLPERPAWVEEKERREAIDELLAETDRFLALLRDWPTEAAA